MKDPIRHTSAGIGIRYPMRLRDGARDSCRPRALRGSLRLRKRHRAQSWLAARYRRSTSAARSATRDCEEDVRWRRMRQSHRIDEPMAAAPCSNPAADDVIQVEPAQSSGRITRGWRPDHPNACGGIAATPCRAVRLEGSTHLGSPRCYWRSVRSSIVPIVPSSLEDLDDSAAQDACHQRR
jgi:hypothetical protein